MEKELEFEISIDEYYITRNGTKVLVTDKNNGIARYIDGPGIEYLCFEHTGKMNTRFNKECEMDIVAQYNDTYHNSPVQTRTVDVIVGGNYGNLTVYFVDGDIRVEFTKSKHTMEELRHAAKCLVEIADFQERLNSEK